MAITNASDLLVYAKTASAVAQVTRIYVKETNPITNFSYGENVILNNVVDSSGVVFDGGAATVWLTGGNSGTDILGDVKTELETHGYNCTSVATDGDYKYINATNGADGIVPTLELVNGTLTFADDAVIIEIITPGSSAVYDAVAFSTQASYNASLDLRDCTNKDSGGFAEYKGGLKSFEVSTELLQSVNPDVPLDGTDFFHELSERDEVNIAFSDRIRNIILTNLTTAGVDGFALVSATQTISQTDPFGNTTASKIENTTTTLNRLQYSVSPGRLEDKNVTWTFYAKGVGSNTSISFFAEKSGGASIPPSEVKVLSGTYTTITEPGTASRAVNGLSTSSFTRIQVTYNNFDATGGQPINFMVFPGGNPTTQTIGDAVIVSSWQIEFKDEATAYQDPTTITQYQGNALVTSVNFDAGVEDNLTCSATFTGTGITTLNT